MIGYLFLGNADPEDLFSAGLNSHPNSGNNLKKESEFDRTHPLRLELEEALDFDQIFKIVKKSVRAVIGKERSGLGLALSDLPSTLGAFWQLGGNYIVMNENLLDAMAKNVSTFSEFNSYVYMILTHEYLHSLGFTDEMEARKLTAKIANNTFGEDHPAYVMSSGDVWTMYPFLRETRNGAGRNVRIIGNFDSDSTSYIG